ncbi:MAG: hypothetical protein ACP5NS_01330 [Candidatus Pacearchaeota archaeon]
MELKKRLRQAVCGFAMGFLLGFLALQLVTACPSPLQCANFTQSDKIQDCNYVTSSGLSYSEQQDSLCILWDQEYDFPPYQTIIYPQAQSNFYFSYSEIDTSRFILLFKILIFIFFNYAIFSFLTKTSFMRKCLPVD